MTRIVLVHGSFHGAWCCRDLVPLLEDFSAPPAPIYALRPPGGVPSTAAVALVDHLAAALGTRPPS